MNHVALLRAVNVAGHNKVRMGDLRRLAAELGLADGQTLLQSGNLIFHSDARSCTELENSLEEAARDRLLLHTDFFVRTARDWKSIVEANPFPDEAEKDPSHLVIMLLKSASARKRVKLLQDSIKGREIVRVNDREAYISYPDGIGRSRLTAAVIEQGLGTHGTGRNWNTVLRIDSRLS